MICALDTARKGLTPWQVHSMYLRKCQSFPVLGIRRFSCGGFGSYYGVLELLIVPLSPGKMMLFSGAATEQFPSSSHLCHQQDS